MGDFKEYKAAFLEQNDLKHYGVKGMRWNHHKYNPDQYATKPGTTEGRSNLKYNATDYIRSKDDWGMYKETVALARKLQAAGKLTPEFIKEIAPFIGRIGDPDNPKHWGQFTFSDEDRAKCKEIGRKLSERMVSSGLYGEEKADRTMKAAALKKHLQNKKKKR